MLCSSNLLLFLMFYFLRESFSHLMTMLLVFLCFICTISLCIYYFSFLYTFSLKVNDPPCYNSNNSSCDREHEVSAFLVQIVLRVSQYIIPDSWPSTYLHVPPEVKYRSEFMTSLFSRCPCFGHVFALLLPFLVFDYRYFLYSAYCSFCARFVRLISAFTGMSILIGFHVFGSLFCSFSGLLWVRPTPAGPVRWR
jgi:hypothetical protein